MKICAIICEYNPFHNGHLFQLNAAKARSNADAVVCFMSGNFVQRGENAIMDKYTRAKHAALAGADVVIELPTPFATANAELFAKGAIHLLTSIPSVKYLCFGAETADKRAFRSAASYLNDEPKAVSEKIKFLTAQGVSFANARAQAFAQYIPTQFLSSPNNILGIEYTRALQEKTVDVEILPIQRVGGGYADTQLFETLSSATAIRESIIKGEDIRTQMPPFVFDDIPQNLSNELHLLEKYAVLANGKETLANVCDCTEGLENAFIKAATLEKPFAQTLVSARYTASRIRRIALQNLLKIDETLIRQSLQSPLYLRVLAAKKERTDVLSALSESLFPLITRAHDENALCDSAKRCFAADSFAERVYSVLFPTAQKEKNIFI